MNIFNMVYNYGNDIEIWNIFFKIILNEFCWKKIRWFYINYMLIFMVNKKRINCIIDNIVVIKGCLKFGIFILSYGGLELCYILFLVIIVLLFGWLLNDLIFVKIFVLIKYDMYVLLRWCIFLI